MRMYNANITVRAAWKGNRRLRLALQQLAPGDRHHATTRNASRIAAAEQNGHLEVELQLDAERSHDASDAARG